MAEARRRRDNSFPGRLTAMPRHAIGQGTPLAHSFVKTGPGRMTHAQLASMGPPPGSPGDALAFFLGGSGFDDFDFDFGGGFESPMPLDVGGTTGGGSGACTSSKPSNSDLAGVLSQWRCLDSAHAAGCQRCTPPPPVAEAARYELVGDPGKRNGEKKLRSLLTSTPEWTSSDARGAAALQLQGQYPRLAASLRSRTSSSLSKELMLALLSLWTYKSNLWVRRGNRPKRAATAASAPQPASAEATSWAATHEQLQQLSKASFAGVVGLLARVEAERCPESAIAYTRELMPLRVIVEHLRTKWMPFAANRACSCVPCGILSAAD